MHNFYCYIWFDPKNDSPIYVGKGHGSRAKSHLQSKQTRLSKLLNKRKSEGFILEPKVIQCESESDAFELETFLISEIGRKDLAQGPLFNLTDGGEGPTGLICSKESRLKISKALTGQKHTLERVENAAKARSKTFKIIFPSGEEQVISNLNSFCKAHSLNQGNMTIIAKNGRLKQHKGFKCQYV